jgi:hypothetical protein
MGDCHLQLPIFSSTTANARDPLPANTGTRVSKAARSFMANSFGTDILIQAPDPEQAASFYVDQLGFEITGKTPEMISLQGKHINLFIERGPALGPVLEVFVGDVEEARQKLVQSGCEIVKDEPEVPRCYVKDPFGLIYNLSR